ncbi:MAG: lysophospholipid acyltransferase family protein [Candidatus Omnitrophica bacterium]|nr:lysophospholipid acyltransferase family protein [Candidatus Omnitrophota bacterium]
MAKNRPRRVFIFLLFRLISFIVLAFPIRIGLMLGQAFGSLSFYILKKDREKALKNLDIAFGDSKSKAEKRSIAKKVFENLGKNFVEVISIPKFNRGNINRYVSCNNIGLLMRFVQENKGAIILSAHFGNWELLAHYISMQGLPINVIARRARMDGLEAFLAGIRKKNNVNVIYRDASAKEIVDFLRNKKFVGIMPDQDMDSVSGVFVDFFGKSAWTPSGPAVLNLLTGVPIVPCFIVRKPFGHEFLIDGPAELVKTGDRKEDILENTQRYTKIIEDYIKRFPEHWVWFHDRWKTKICDQRTSE